MRFQLQFIPGQRLRNTTNGVTGIFLRKFQATGFGEIVIVKVPDGRLYRAPIHEWLPLPEPPKLPDESQVCGNDCPGGQCDF